MQHLTPAQRRFAEASLTGANEAEACQAARVNPLTLKRWKNLPGWYDKLLAHQWAITQIGLLPLVRKIIERGEVSQPLARILELLQPERPKPAPVDPAAAAVPQNMLELIRLAEKAEKLERELADADCHCASAETSAAFTEAVIKAEAATHAPQVLSLVTPGSQDKDDGHKPAS